MAKDSKTKPEAASASPEERIYNVPLRKDWIKVPRNKRARKSISTIRMFLKRHMKGEKIVISQGINHAIWYRGIERPPGKIKIRASKDSEGTVSARLPDEAEMKGKQDKGRIGKMRERLGRKKPDIAAEKLPSKLEEKKEELKEKKGEEEPKKRKGNEDPKEKGKKDKKDDAGKADSN